MNYAEKLTEIYMKTKLTKSKINSFFNAYNHFNQRYDLLYMWAKQDAITCRQFKFLVENIEVKTIDHFVLDGEKMFSKSLPNSIVLTSSRL